MILPSSSILFTHQCILCTVGYPHQVGGPIHTVINVAGGWMGGNATSDTGVFDALDKMWEFNVKSAFAGTCIVEVKLVLEIVC